MILICSGPQCFSLATGKSVTSRLEMDERIALEKAPLGVGRGWWWGGILGRPFVASILQGPVSIPSVLSRREWPLKSWNKGGSISWSPCSAWKTNKTKQNHKQTNKQGVNDSSSSASRWNLSSCMCVCALPRWTSERKALPSLLNYLFRDASPYFVIWDFIIGRFFFFTAQIKTFVRFIQLTHQFRTCSALVSCRIWAGLRLNM